MQCIPLCMTFEPIDRLQRRRIRCEQRRKLPISIQKRNAQVLRHGGLAHLATHRQLGRGCGEHDDLLQEAYLGLIQGSERFEPSRGNRFSSYAMRLATGRIQHFRRDRVRCLRIPWRLDALHARASRLQEQRAQAQNPPLSDRQIASRLGVSLDRWRQARIGHQQHHLISLDQPRSRDRHANEAEGDIPLIQTLADVSITRNDDQQREWLQEQLERLPQRTRSCIVRHYLEGASAKAIAREDNCSCSEVKRILESSLERLRQLASNSTAAMANTAATAV